jgi:putative hemolysin
MKDYVIPVNPFEERKEAYSSIGGMRDTLKHLQEGGCIGIFPAGEVSNKNNEIGEVLDKEWELTALNS